MTCLYFAASRDPRVDAMTQLLQFLTYIDTRFILHFTWYNNIFARHTLDESLETYCVVRRWVSIARAPFTRTSRPTYGWCGWQWESIDAKLRTDRTSDGASCIAISVIDTSTIIIIITQEVILASIQMAFHECHVLVETVRLVPWMSIFRQLHWLLHL